ncbi:MULTISPECIES: DUF896 domain-containing protein [Thermoanaerobacterium]|uniref:UPF0291 protein Thexy_0284 n=1 Tax=Thermoanaerobacterium xylanolyticum (strain ATCC 49914 / DSM 7097 / LX-11) TaxID=858215 RepID=F6BGC2_THEXL|nr:DUF896 domain-containing protein [Thermoanaerobacterium xylanolyticum]AEF16340.1 UPF0291 protein [Thermoanaerobacterium xylanolyticum LX-11]
MITKEMIDRINYLYHKSKNEGLTDEEKIEQSKLRMEYVKEIRQRVKQQLDSIKFVDEDNCHDDCCHHHHHH